MVNCLSSRTGKHCAGMCGMCISNHVGGSSYKAVRYSSLQCWRINHTNKQGALFSQLEHLHGVGVDLHLVLSPFHSLGSLGALDLDLDIPG
jgi:hypothetical protein